MTAAQALNLKKLRIVPLPSDKALDDFQSGEREIDRSLSKCCEWHTCHRARVFCAYLDSEPRLYGFYCLGLHAHPSEAVAALFTRASDDSRSFVPFIYLNYLAVQTGWHRQKIGTMLLLNAIERCALAIRNIGAYGIALNALNDNSAALYDRYGFRVPPGARQHNPLMVLPARAALDLFPASALVPKTAT
ncbi:MAG TPA: GNAT family N-acetyltransferase [Stellaceae bacterium]|nr:GNAT family N-acetyltransferase [Stellaceae bacterium]